ncbi:MAG TPA: D-glycero-beta-D-manno-heptose 1-phosphate adenylyltransferase [Candidatus Saccharimonadales bacterium]|nr:D-glycero-beta-D-manno-heptose 1-phosphate adenylyltransferase [Candidatus Saccharimonadales bacterium]
MSADLLTIIQNFHNLKVLVIGESTTDIDLIGTSERVAREAPVPVVSIEHVKRVPGRASNAAVNVAQLGGQAEFMSVVGDDDEGRKLTEILAEQGVITDNILVDPKRRTQTIQRVMAGDHMLVRFDDGSQEPLSESSEALLISKLDDLYADADAILISDYGYNIISDALIAEITKLQSKHRKPLVVDSKYLDRYKHVGVTAVKPNYKEAVALLGLTRTEKPGKRAAQLQRHADKLLEITGAEYAMVTLDVEGSIVLHADQEPYHTYSKPMENSKSVGAGDTYTSAFTLALAANASIGQAAEIAQKAAMVVVQKSGTATCDHEELIQAFNGTPKYIGDRDELRQYVERIKREGRRIVFTNGCFDILHSGHVTYLNQAKDQGDVLILAVNSDASVKRLKGPERPLNSLQDRVQVLAGLQAVDMVVSFGEDTPVELLKIVQPDIYIKGGDYTRDSLPETATVEEYGGAVAIMPFVMDRSTTGLIQKIRTVTENMAGGQSHGQSTGLGTAY